MGKNVLGADGLEACSRKQQVVAVVVSPEMELASFCDLPICCVTRSHPTLFSSLCFSYLYGKTLIPEVDGGPQPTMHIIWTPVPQSVTLPGEEKEKSWEFLTAVAESEEDVKRNFIEGMTLIQSGSLYLSHIQAWTKLWEGSSVEVDGPPSLSQAIYGCLYYLLSSIPPLASCDFPFSGISPGGLSNGTQDEDYWGHVFWDQVRETLISASGK